MNPSWDLKSVRIGEWNTETNPDCYEDDKECAPPVVDNLVVQKIVHPNYVKGTRSQHNDIALLRLESKVKFNVFVRPICLPLDLSLKGRNFTGYSYEVAGECYKLID